ncbi:MAG: lipocalin family protein [Opitutales bacterium]
MRTLGQFGFAGLIALLLAGCQNSASNMPEQELADYVDLERFMGTWYVLAHKPTFLDDDAHAAVEIYERDGEKIRTTYRFRAGSFDGKVKEYHPVATIYDEESNAEWRMRFFYFFKQPYLILYVDPEYETTVIGYPDRSMAWIMARDREISEDRYAALEAELTERGYDLSILRRMPQPPVGEG